jgi:putative NADH-flavin reductase
MKIVIFGASGKTGTLLIEQALAKGYQVVAYARRAGSVAQQNPNLKIVIGELNDKDKLKEAIMGADACISALGGNSLYIHATEIVTGIDNIVSIMEQEKVGRIIYLSSIGAGGSRNTMSPVAKFFIADLMFRVPLADHNANEQRIAKSKLQWTVVRPSALTDGPETVTVNHGNQKTIPHGNPRVSRTNLASFMLEQLTDTNNINTAVWLYGSKV